VGCVELALPGKSFFSTDAGLFNLPVCLELALNRGRRMSGGPRVGADTPAPGKFRDIGQVIEAFSAQVNFMVGRMTDDFQVVEKGNALYHPTPFSSMLVDGCLESGKDVSEGGALYNSSGLQGVGVADVADSLAALETVVFVQHRYSMPEVLKALKDNFAADAVMWALLKNAPKFGNDNPLPDNYANMVAGIFHKALAMHRNTRGGPYVPGFYTVTCHVAFGKLTGALPSGRRAGAPFAPGLGPCNGYDRLGPTAVMNSTANVDPRLSPNGYALNLRFDPATVSGERGTGILMALARGFFESGGMEVQFNILDQDMLADARRHPGKYPGLVVRVSGYCAYFDDLPDAAKDEIIARTRLQA
jgi:pyruvate-formate lyase